ncbi:TIR domain-containing protein [Stenotrophomonas sp. HMWF003]|uniref:TIR domain-containing protein n=1 Tax=Stenotrophomonas sp. HMWF003 TaxID=2056840 RepID=UPI000D4E013A|nr:TIR domain-containing protein [Stenotrophomonas sp. HMWF003]PTT62351.1 hypothetical protein DBR34_09080 [Stenotrophomonas sp. HMWF003]PTT79897.1 hypothetical protein DBR42_20500 [Pelomonas sp. HMWF004]
MASRPRVLILSASDQEPLDVANALQRQLDYKCDPTVWTQDVFQPGRSAFESFTNAVDNHAYGIFVLTPDDTLHKGDEVFLVPRMNVVFELGYFAAKHGIHRAFLLTPRGDKRSYLSDLAGIQPVEFNLERFRKGEQVPALGAAVAMIQSAIAADRLEYPKEVQNRRNLLAMEDNQTILAEERYCLAAKLKSGHNIRLTLTGIPRESGAELNSGWLMGLRPTAVAWDNSPGIVGNSQSFWATGPSEAFTDFRVSRECRELTIEIHENDGVVDGQQRHPDSIKRFHVQDKS